MTTEIALEHLTEQLEARFPEGFALFFNEDGEFGDALVSFPNRMCGRFLGENVEYHFPSYWGGTLATAEEPEWTESDDEE